MMDIGPPDQKRPRLTGPAPGPWPSSTETSRQLPPVPAAASSYQHPSPFSRPPDPQHLLDRRPSAHTEHAQYDQESRRPSSGPSHVYHHPHPPPPFAAQRETMVKRDPSDEPPPSQYRPPSTGAAGDHNVTAPPPHHDGSGRYLPPFEPRAPYSTSFPPPQSPMSATEQYHPQFPGPPRDAFPSVTYPGAGSQSGKPQRKAQRAAQACDSCRTLKAKCDEGRPSCSSCREKGIDCRYRDPPPKQQDKASADILESLMRIEQSVHNMQSEMAAYSTQMKQIQAVVNHRHLPASELKQEEVADPDPIPDPAQIPPQVEYSAQPSISSESHLLPSTESPFSSTPGQLRLPDRHDPEPSDPEEDEDEGGDPGPPKPPSIPVNHTTGAARLLLVGPIAEMCKGIIKGSKIKNEKYPIIQEEKRGLLRLYGRGEGTDIPLGYDKEPLIDHGSDSTSGDTNSDVSSPAGEEWGQLGGLTPPSTAPENFQRGRISGEGMPDFSRDVVLSLVKNYKETFNLMHPLLIPRGLDLLVENFLKSIPDTHAKPKQVSTLAGYTSGHSSTVAAGFVRAPESPGNKRKRSPGLVDYPPNEVRGGDWELKSGHPFRSISTALVLCVLALGAIAQHKGKIPDCVPTYDREADSSWSASPTIRNGHPPSPIHSSPSMSTPMGITSPQDTDRGQARSRRTSIEGAFTTKGYSTKAKNLDVIPGLAYFAYATDIIGNQLGGNSLQHVHVNILAGLYHGQLARVMESHAYIHQACRGLQVILRPKLDRFKKVKAANDLVPARDNPLVIAFWTCLQLESDIVAELPCPHSGILTYEEDMPGPNLRDATNVDGFDPRVMESYSAQLYIRKHLNQLHNMFYRPENDSEFPSVFAGREPRHFPTIEACEESINHVPLFAPTMKWTDSDPPAKEILQARLRAKYYGAQVITYRHFVLKILEHSAAKTSKPGEQISSEFKTGIAVPSINSNATRPEDFDPKVLEYAKKCIRALIKSTTAFYGVGDPAKDRLIVTNIWGTAHAQWGNILTLLAAYQDPILTKFVNGEELQKLLITTMAFLQLSGHSSSALDIDYKILKHVGRELKLLPAEAQGANASSSFSSTTTGDVPMT